MFVDPWLPRAAAVAPRRVAVHTPAGSWTYAELLTTARDGAGWLAQRGVGAGHRVAIALPPGLGFVQALHAVMWLGAVAVPIDPRLTAAERERLGRGAAAVVEQPLWEGPSPGGSAGPAGSAARLDLEAAAVIVHTSGTTAAPRPVSLTYGNFLWSALGSAVALGLDPDERWLCAMPVSHVGGLSILLRSVIYATTAVVHERFEPEAVLRALQDEDITLVSVVATTLGRLLDAGLRRPPRLRLALAGGGPVPAALLARAREAGVAVSETYGLTESCSQATTVPAALAGDPGQHGAGSPLFCTHVSIGGDGEIFLRGATIAPGAVGDDGWLATGDLGRLDAGGSLHVTGRKADTIISGGENVAPAEVEAVLEAHPDVLEAAVVARADPRWGEAVTAVVVPRNGDALDPEVLRAHCAAVLAPYKVPRRVLLADGPLPRTRSGKLLRREL